MGKAMSETRASQEGASPLRMLQHYEQVTRNVFRSCRFFGISGTQFYIWLQRYWGSGKAGLRDRHPGPRLSPFRTPPQLEALVLQVRRER